jgi:hypothetical protein
VVKDNVLVEDKVVKGGQGGGGQVGGEGRRSWW